MCLTILAFFYLQAELVPDVGRQSNPHFRDYLRL